MKIKSSIILISFPSGLKIGDMHRRSMFYQVSEMDGLQAIVHECFVANPKSEGMPQWPMFYRSYEMDGCHYLTRFPFLGVEYIYNSLTSNNTRNAQ